MVGSTLVEVCGRLIFSFTRTVAEHVNRSEAEIIPQMCGYDILQNTGMEWYCQPVDEFIFQEYSDGQVSSTEYVTNFGQARFTNACTIENCEDAEQVGQDRSMAWKRLRPSLTLTIWYSLWFGFLISFLSAGIIGILAILLYYLNYQAVLTCRTRTQQLIPIKIQWTKTISESISCIPIYAWFFLNMLFFFRPYQISGLKRKIFLISFVFYLLDSLYRLTLQGFGISHSELTRRQRIPGNVLFL